jgi:predicted Rossmann-fold nucleotide-binding protein
MKQMASKKTGIHINNNVITGIDDADYKWDSLETMVSFYNAEIKKANESLNQLSVMEDAKAIIDLCSKIKGLKLKLKNCR